MSSQVNVLIFVVIGFSLLWIVVAALAGYKLVGNLLRQNRMLSALRHDVELLRERVNALKHESPARWSDDSYNYLAVGNSITKHGLAEYWWNNIGMAASCESCDYVHLIAAGLRRKSAVCFNSHNFYVWEVQSADRAECLELLDAYLDVKIDLVTLQLGENANDLTTFEDDFVELIRYIEKKCPRAQIIVIDDFWPGYRRSALKENAAMRSGVEFINLSQIKGDPSYQCGKGRVVYDAAGNSHIVRHDGVARDPGDAGMRYIAEAVLAAVK